jgi:RNA polymerase sigma factor (sigma-70 family)
MTKPQSDLAQLAYQRYRGGLKRYLMRRLDRAQDAQDLAQEVYLRLLRVDAAELVRQPRAYMFRIASHVVYEFRLREEREKEHVSIDSTALDHLADRVSGPATGDFAEGASLESELARLLERLPPVERAIVLLQKREGLSYKEIARQLGLSVHTVKKYLFRALLRLRQEGT